MLFLNRFDVLRLGAALAVFTAHGSFLYCLYLPVPFVGHSLGSLAVYVFFFISGYLIFQSWVRLPLWKVFFIKRFVRIFPGLLVAVGFSVFVLGWAVTTLPTAVYLRAPGTWLNFFNNALALATVQTLPGVFENNPFARAVNGSLWTIRYELAMYVLLVLIARVARGWRGIYSITALVFVLLWFAARRGQWDSALQASGWGLVFQWQDFCGFGVPFFMGSAFAAHLIKPRYWMIGATAVALVVALLARSDVLRQVAAWCLVVFGTFCVAFTAVPAYSAAERGRVDLSYGVYIYAFPVQQAMTQWSLAAAWPLWFCMGASLVLVLLLASASWFGVERPCIKWAQRRLSTPLATAHT